MKNVVLFGDSIFDNETYVPNGMSVIDHLRSGAKAAKATLLAVDGAVASSVFAQLDECPPDASHIFLSVGGNDALHISSRLFSTSAGNVGAALAIAYESLQSFASEYKRLVEKLKGFGLPIAVCTIYDRVPGLGRHELGGLMMFNEIITRIAFEAKADLIDLRLLCCNDCDYSPVSPIEPSEEGGRKIARAIERIASGCHKPSDSPCVFA